LAPVLSFDLLFELALVLGLLLVLARAKEATDAPRDRAEELLLLEFAFLLALLLVLEFLLALFLVLEFLLGLELSLELDFQLAVTGAHRAPPCGHADHAVVRVGGAGVLVAQNAALIRARSFGRPP